MMGVKKKTLSQKNVDLRNEVTQLQLAHYQRGESIRELTKENERLKSDKSYLESCQTSALMMAARWEERARTLSMALKGSDIFREADETGLGRGVPR